MASVPAIDDAGRIGRELVGRGLIVKHGVCPSLRVRESLAIFLNEKNVLQGVRHPYKKGGLSALLRFPLDLRNLGALRERLTVTGNASPVGIDHRGIGDHHLEQVFSLADGDNLPVFVSPEIRERESIRNLQGVLVLSGNGHADQGSEHYRNSGNRKNAFALHRWHFYQVRRPDLSHLIACNGSRLRYHLHLNQDFHSGIPREDAVYTHGQ
jgi:hypothetical protein